MRRNTGIGANTDIGVRRPEVDRLELRMAVGEMQQRHLALGIELEQIVLRQLLLCQRACGVGGAQRRRARNRH
jgi:hypothetical protein